MNDYLKDRFWYAPNWVEKKKHGGQKRTRKDKSKAKAQARSRRRNMK